MRTLQTSIVAATLALSGCAAVSGMQANDAEDILAEAGFTREAAAAAPAAAGGTALPTRQLTRVEANGATYYEFSDPQCQCVYVGGPNEYAKLEQLRDQRRADHAWYLRRSNLAYSAGYSETWGPWNPGGLDVK